jgi:hypothetical protein
MSRLPSIFRRRAAQPESQPAEPPIPAGVDLDPAGAAPASSFLTRSKLRRRLRFLRRQRDVLLRDLGGLVFDLHRFGQRRDQLVVAKLSVIRSADADLRSLEQVLGDRRPVHDLRVPGIGGACPSCGALLPSDARFCAYCGTPASAARHPGGPLSSVGDESSPPAEAGSAAAPDAPAAPAGSAPDAQPEPESAGSSEVREPQTAVMRPSAAGHDSPEPPH